MKVTQALDEVIVWNYWKSQVGVQLRFLVRVKASVAHTVRLAQVVDPG